MVDRTGFSSGIITPGQPTNSPVKGFTAIRFVIVFRGQRSKAPSMIQNGILGLLLF